MLKTLIVSESKHLNDFLSKELASIVAQGASITRAATAADAKKICQESHFDLIIVDSFKIESARDLSVSLSHLNETAGIIAMETSANYDETCKILNDYGIMVFTEPIDKKELKVAVNLILAANKRIANIKHQNQDLKKQIDDIKIISRAKVLLMKNLSYSENQAHKHIEKQAMNLRISKSAVAMNVLKTYEPYEP